MSARKNKSETPDKAGVGRPRSKVSIPSGKFTFAKFAFHNGATDEAGNELPKEQRRVCLLTLRNWISRDAEKGDKSEVVKLEELGKATNEGGLGRKPFLFLRRSQYEAGKNLKRGKGKGSKDLTVPVTDVSATPEVSVVETPAVTETPVTA